MTHEIHERALPRGVVLLRCTCGWGFTVIHRNALARASLVRGMRANHLQPPARRVETSTSTLPSGRVLTLHFVRCPGSCGGTAGFERLATEGRAKLNTHGGGRLGFASCSWCGKEVVLIEEEVSRG